MLTESTISPKNSVSWTGVRIEVYGNDFQMLDSLHFGVGQYQHVVDVNDYSDTP